MWKDFRQSQLCMRELLPTIFRVKMRTSVFGTCLNRSGKPQTELLEINGKISDDFRYVEVYNDNEITCEERNGRILLKGELADQSVAVITRFKKRMNAKLLDDKLLVECNEPPLYCQLVYDTDNFINPPEKLNFVDGKLQANIKNCAKKVIVKLYQDKFLQDEIILVRK